MAFLLSTVGVAWLLYESAMAAAIAIAVAKWPASTPETAKNATAFAAHYLSGGRDAAYWKWHHGAFWQVLPPAVLFIATLCALLPVMILILGDTRSRCKVLPSHVLRAAVFGAMPLWLALVTMRLCQSLGNIPSLTSDFWSLSPTTSRTWWFDDLYIGWLLRALDDFANLPPVYQLIYACGATVWLVRWWRITLADAWQVPTWKQVLCAQFIAAALAGLTALAIHPGMLEYWSRLP